MKVKIKKKGKTKEFKIIESWQDVNLKSWLRLLDLQKGSKSKEALETVATLSDIPKNLINELGIQDVALIMSKLTALQEKQSSLLKRIIVINGKEYGFHPNLEEITLGEYADIETFMKNGLEKHLPELMAILYRPVVEKKNDVYTIEAYDGNIKIRAEEMKKMSAEQVQAAMVFFWTFVNELLRILLLYLMEQIPTKQQTQLIQALQKSGVGSV
tara:strand:+ start:273 stop:914 length:642 start_codon:yes stop_codon:yes gene_type:complete